MPRFHPALDGELGVAELRFLEQDVVPMQWSPEQGECRRAQPPRGRSVEQQIDQVEMTFLAAPAAQEAGASFSSLSDAIGRMPAGEAEQQYRTLVSQVPNPGA